MGWPWDSITLDHDGVVMGVFRQGRTSEGKCLCSGWCRKIPPESVLGHISLPGSAANIFLLQGGTGARVMHVRDALQGKGPQRQPQKRLDRGLEAVTEAVGGGNCRFTSC